MVGARHTRNEMEMWEQVKWAMVKSVREVWLSESGVWRNDDIKAAVRRKKAVWKVLAPSNEETKERCIEAYRVEKKG